MENRLNTALLASCLAEFSALLPAFWKVVSECKGLDDGMLKTQGHIFESYVVGLIAYITNILCIRDRKQYLDVLSADELILVLKNTKYDCSIEITESIKERVRETTEKFRSLCETMAQRIINF